MTSTTSVREPSLLPYCQPRASGVGLRIATSDAPSPASAMPTAALVETCGPLTELLWAQVVLNGKQPISDLLLLVQADHYRLTPSELKPITNVDIEKQWQLAIDRTLAQQGDALVMGIPAQKDPQGRVLPFRPLFFCRQKNRFAHALCPGCGAGLILCRDDQVLNSAGLPGFSESLERYLYCPACHQASPESPFYNFIKDSRQPDNVRDSRGLIEDFSALLAKEALGADLPCVGCDEAASCYGQQTLVLDRMRPVRFYPFYLILQPAPSLNALDFLALLSNASPAEITQNLSQRQNQGRLLKFTQWQEKLGPGQGFLFAGQPKLFLEVLYLKLAFLHELWVSILSLTSGIPHPVASMSLRGLWLEVQRSGNRLPYLWNFSLQLVDRVGQPAKESSDAKLALLHKRQFLARTWFYALLVNADQTMEDVLAVVEPLALQGSTTGVIESAPEQTYPAMAARHIFWQAPPLEIDAAWDLLWKRALAMGLELLDTGSDWSEERFLRQLADLQNQVHQNLFQTPVKMAEAMPGITGPETEAIPDADAQIALILQDLLQQWPAPADGAAAETVVDQAQDLQATQIIRPNEDGDFEETVILSAEERRAADSLAQQPAKPSMEETVIITPEAAKKPLPYEADDFQKTVLISPGERGNSAPSAEPPDELDKTVLISPGERRKSTPPGGSPNDQDKTVLIQPKGSQANDELEKTVIIGPAGTAPTTTKSKDMAQGSDKSKVKPKNKPPVSDDLEATVIISRDALKNGKPKP